MLFAAYMTVGIGGLTGMFRSQGVQLSLLGSGGRVRAG